jgi:hypothetical protein
MTYADLLQQLSELSPEQLQMDVTVNSVHNNEYFPGGFAIENEDEDILDVPHPIITID